jgi:hypothetical protein
MKRKNKKLAPNTIIFLDVDGVLTSMRCNGYYDFDLWAVHYFRWACEESGARIVMSTAWRVFPQARGWFTKVFGEYLHEDWRTGEDANRGLEIDEWLSRHPEVTNHVIVDDTLNGLENREALVLTSLNDGLLTSHRALISAKLGLKVAMPRLKHIPVEDVCFYTKREKRDIGYHDWISELQERNARKLVQESADEVN